MKKLIFLAALVPILSLSAEETFYPHPGDVKYTNGKWEGVDHLANLSSSIPIEVSVVIPSGKDFPVDSGAVISAVENVWSEYKLENRNPSDGRLQFFVVKVLVYPIEGGAAATVEAKLFEEVEPKRSLIAKEHKFQAVTWEQESLLVASKDTFNALLTKTVESVAKNFAMRLEAFQKAQPVHEKSALKPSP